MSFPSDLAIARSVRPRPIVDVAADLGLRPDEIELLRPDEGEGDPGRGRARRARAPPRQVRRRDGDHADAARRGQDDDHGRPGPGPQPDRPQGIGRHPPAVARARSSGSRAAPRAAATPRSSRWRTSTSTSRATSTPSAPPTTWPAAFLDNHLHHGNALGIDPFSIRWPRVVDISDRAIRRAVIGLGGKENGVPREAEWVITVASEVMAILALAKDLFDLRARLGRIVVATNRDGQGGHGRGPPASPAR